MRNSSPPMVMPRRPRKPPHACALRNAGRTRTPATMPCCARSACCRCAPPIRVVRALALKPTAASWAALGDIQSASGEAEDAIRCYANAWKCEQGEAIAPGPHEAGIDTAHVTLEERDEHGMPRLPGEQSSPVR